LFACLRINRTITGATARLTTDLPGSALVGRDSHPLDDKPNFMESSHDSLLSDQHCLVATTIWFFSGLSNVHFEKTMKKAL
jgi:hypothetical protein